MKYLFVSGLIIYSLSAIAFEKQYFGFGVILIGLSMFLFINSFLTYLLDRIEIKPKDRIINTNENNNEFVNWVNVSEQLPNSTNYLLLYDGQFVGYGYYSFVHRKFTVVDYADYKDIIKWAEIPCGGLK